MFNKIKRDFLILNMAIISILIIIVCLSIYISMRYTIVSTMNNEMVEIEQKYESYYTISRIKDSLAIEQNPTKDGDKLLFIVDVSEECALRYLSNPEANSYYLIEDIISVCMNVSNDKGLLKYNGSFYFFSKIYFPNSMTRLIVLDVSDKMLVLHNLLANIILIGGISLFLIFIISKFFTTKSVRPLEEAFYKQKNFISDASHELKTPLAVIKTNLDILGKSENLTNDDKKWLGYAKDEINQMSKMVNEFLYLAQMENKTEEKEYLPFDLSEVVNGVLLSMEPIAFEKEIMIQESIKDDVFVKGDADEIKRLIVILVDNAIKYCNVSGEIITELNVDGNNGCFLIKNSGTVIEAKDKDIIFERFYRSNKERERKTQSYGIGLSIAKLTCQKHGFTIKAFPENNKTCFKVMFKVLK